MVAHSLQMFRASLPLRLGSALVALGAFVWVLVHPAVLAAQSQRARSAPAAPAQLAPDLSATLTALAVSLTALRGQAPPLDGVELAEILAHGGSPALLLPPPRSRTVPLAELRQRLTTQAAQVRQQMAATARHLQQHRLPEVLHQRHRDAVAQTDAAMTTLLQHLDAIDTAPTATRRALAAAQALAYLQSQEPRRAHKQVDPHYLPFSVPDSQVRPPRERARAFHSALEQPQPVLLASAQLLPGLLAPDVTASLLPVPDDLAETEDLQFTNAIQALAAELEHQPVKIYNWVHNHIAFLPTHGSMQGAHMTLQTRRGNAFDTASLLIALLRASDIPARYVTGTIQLPIGQVMNWVGGVTVPEAALQVLGQGGIPSIGLVEGGVIKAVRMEHVWVEAYVDFVPSRGANHMKGDSWVPMDAAFKQYVITEGLQLQENFPLDAQGIREQVKASAQINDSDGWFSGLDQTLLFNLLTTYQGQLELFVETQQPNATVRDVMGTKTIIASQRAVLAAGLPYQQVVRGATFAVFPDHLRHQYQFSLYASSLDHSLDLPMLRFTASLPTLAGKKITLSYAPASQDDAELITSFLPELPADHSLLDPASLRTSLPGYLMRVTAELRVDGRVVASSGALMLGQELLSIEGVRDPIRGWEFAEANTPVAGEYRAIALDAAGIGVHQMQDAQETLTETLAAMEAGQTTGLSTDQVIGDPLFSVVTSYFAMTDMTRRFHAALADIVTYVRPSFGSATLVAQSQRLFGLPLRVSFQGIEMDIDRQTSIVASKENDRQVQVAFVQHSGLMQSAFEHLVPEWLFTDDRHPGEAVSAVKALAMAHNQGQRIFIMSQDNILSALPQLGVAPNVREEIRQAVATGKVVSVSEHPVSVGNWTGVGYVILDPETGSGAYKISGGANGSFMAGEVVGLLLASVLGLPCAGAVALNVFFGLAVFLFVTLTMLALIRVANAYGDVDSACLLVGTLYILAMIGLLVAFLFAPEIAAAASFLTASRGVSFFGLGLALVGILGFFLPSKSVPECIAPSP